MTSVRPRGSGWVLWESIVFFAKRPTRYREVVLIQLRKEQQKTCCADAADKG
jgi:hypothetical protein